MGFRGVVLVAVACLVGSGASGITIQVDFGPFASAEEAAHAEASIDWRDANLDDDRVCTEAFAAVELQRYLRAMGGWPKGLPPGPMRDLSGFPDNFSIVDDEAQVADDVIRIGKAAGVTDTLGPEEYVLRTRDVDGRRELLIAGGSRVGTLYGVYHLLHHYGVRWYAPGPSNAEVPHFYVIRALPALDVRESPKFATRGFHAWEDRGNPDFILWMARNRLNYWCVEQSEKPLLHKLGIMLVGGGHILTEYYLGPHSEYPYNHPKFAGDDHKPVDPYAAPDGTGVDANGDGKLTYFEAHPEWYGLRGGKRSDRIEGDSGDNFCTSNADAMAEWTKNAATDLAEGRYKDADIMNAWALDGGQWCECDACKAQGSPTDRNILLVHRYAQAIKKAQAEGRINRPVRLLFLAYADVIEPPTRPLPEDFDYDTCIATYFPIVRCYVHNLDEDRCTRNAEYMKHLNGWAVAPERHYRGQLCIGEYYNVSGYKCLPVCYMNTMANDIPLYYKQGARHFHYMHCTTENWGNKALTNWQMAQQLWNPEVGCRALWDDYLKGRYWAAESWMRHFYEGLERMLCNVSQLKYTLARRLAAGEEELFPDNHLKYGATTFERDDGPDLVEILAEAQQCREFLEQAKEQVRKREQPKRILTRIEEDERLFTYGERTVRFYDALCRAYAAVRAGNRDAAQAAREEAGALAELLKADTVSPKYASSHANAENALEASFAAPALERIDKLLAQESGK